MSITPQSPTRQRRELDRKTRRNSRYTAAQPQQNSQQPRSRRVSSSATPIHRAKPPRFCPHRLSPQMRSLLTFQQILSAIAWTLLASALGIYTWSVCVPKLWKQEYEKLETLQRQERHFTAMSETLKDRLAQQAEKPEAGLSKVNPAQMIFLEPASAKSGKKLPNNPYKRERRSHNDAPVAY
jgi:hypothetical protein